MSLRKGEMPCSIKIARVTPLLKVDDLKNVTYYRPISVFPLIMYNHLYKYLIEEKKFSFHPGNSTDHAIVKVVHQIPKFFENVHYTLGVFIDLSEAFDTTLLITPY